MKVFGLFRDNKQFDSRIFKDKNKAIKEMELSNKQFKEYNEFTIKNKINKPLIKLIDLKEIKFNRRNNLEL